MPQPPALMPLSEADYEMIEAAVMETGRGRWFLAEYARRNRHSDTMTLLGAIGRLEAAIRGYGMDRWNFNIDACFNVFMTVVYDENGVWEIRPPKGKPGDYITMLALMPQIVAISNCPILFNACNNFRLKPLTVEILA